MYKLLKQQKLLPYLPVISRNCPESLTDPQSKHTATSSSSLKYPPPHIFGEGCGQWNRDLKVVRKYDHIGGSVDRVCHRQLGVNLDFREHDATKVWVWEVVIGAMIW